MKTSSERVADTYSWRLSKCRGETDIMFARRVDGVLPTYRSQVRDKHPGAHVRVVVHYDDNGASVHVDVLAETLRG